MLTEKDFINIEKQAMQIYQSLELEIIEEIAKRIAKVGYANTVVLNDIQIAQEMGLLYQDVILMVAKYNNVTYEEIAKIFSEAGATTLKFDDEIYTEAGLNPLPIKQSSGMVQLLNSTITKTTSNLQNLVMTAANTSQTQFYNAMNKAYMEVSTGVKSYSQSILDAIDEISSQGAVITYPSGRNMSIESAVRMNVITGVNQTCGKLQELRANELGWDLMEITAHSGARPEHASWQGKIVSRSSKKGYLSLKDIGYGTATGFKGVNCRHDWYPYYKGSSRTYSDKQLKEWQEEKVVYNGEEISKYEATQVQRKLERQIRKDKKEIAGLEGVLTSDNKDSKLLEDTKIQLINKQNKLKKDNAVLNDFVEQTNSRKDYTRLYVGNHSKKNLEITEPLNKIIGTQPNQNTNKRITKIVDKYDKNKQIKIDYLNKKPFRFSISQNKILVNPNHPDFGDYNIKEAITHEIAHMVDINNNISKDRKLRTKIEDLKQILLKQKDELNKALEGNKFKDNIFISDLFAGITKNDISGYWGHPTTYWNNDDNRFCEIVANMEVIYLKKDKNGINLINTIPEFKEIFKEVIKKYGKVI